MILLLALSMIGCANTESQEEQSVTDIGDRLPVVRGEQPPLPTVKSGDVEIPVVLGSYAWKTETDRLGPLELLGIQDYDPVSLEGASEIEVSFEYEPDPSEVFVREVDPSGNGYISERRVEDGKFVITDKSGSRIYAIDARWGVEGNVVDAAAMYYFQVSMDAQTLEVTLERVLAALNEADIPYEGRNGSPNAYDFPREGVERNLYKLELGVMTVYRFKTIEERREVQRDPFPLATVEPPNGSYGMGKVLVFYYDGDQTMAEKLLDAFGKLGVESGIYLD